MAARSKEKVYTTDDIYMLPAGARAELIDNRIYDMAPPNRRHQEILNFLSTEINIYIRSKNGKCKVYPAPFAVFLNKDDTNYVEPDISVVCDENKLDDRGCNGAPDWIIEIVSVSSKKMDYSKKQALYADSGVKEYWIVDYMRNTVMIYYEKDEWVPTIHKFTDVIQSRIFNDLEIDLSKLDGN